MPMTTYCESVIIFIGTWVRAFSNAHTTAASSAVLFVRGGERTLDDFLIISSSLQTPNPTLIIGLSMSVADPSVHTSVVVDLSGALPVL